MVWFKVDDNFAFHPKAMKAGNQALGLWVRAGAWSAGQLSDGEVPASALSVFGGRERDAKRLVEAGLWEYDEATEMYRFHDWDQSQPMKAAVLANRRAGIARQEVFRNPALKNSIRDRDGDLCRYCGASVRWTDRRGDMGGTYDHVIPDGPSDLGNLVVCCRGCNSRKGRRTPEQAGMKLTHGVKTDLAPNLLVRAPRPDPTRPDPTEAPTELLEEVQKPLPPSPKSSRGSRLPNDWQPSADLVAWVRAECPTIDHRAETESFRDWWHAKAGKDATKMDWDLTYKMWMRRTRTQTAKPQRGEPRYFNSAPNQMRIEI